MKKEEKKIYTINDAQTYKKNHNKFILDFTFKLIPCTLIVIMSLYRLFTLPQSVNFYFIITFLLVGVIVFFYTYLILDMIFTFMKIRKYKIDLFL